jgi:uridylate kinase
MKTDPNNTPFISDEEINLHAYLGEPDVIKLCEEIGGNGKDIIAAAWQDGFSSGAEAVEAAIENSNFDALIVFTETSGAYKNDRISLRATFLENRLYITEGFNHNKQEAFETARSLSPESKEMIVTLVNQHHKHTNQPIFKQNEKISHG